MKSASQRHWRKWINAAELECAKVCGGILYNIWYLLDSKDTYTENPNRLLLRHGLCQNCRVNGKACTFFGTICVDPSGDESCNLVEITKVKFMQSQGASYLPPAISYLSVREIILLLVLSSGSESRTR